MRSTWLYVLRFYRESKALHVYAENMTGKIFGEINKNHFGESKFGNSSVKLCNKTNKFTIGEINLANYKKSTTAKFSAYSYGSILASIR